MVAALGLTPLEALNKTIIENEVFKLHEMFIPLQSSHTQSGNKDSEGGRPTKSEGEISDSRQADLDNMDD